MKSHVIRVQNGFKLSQNGYDGFRNSPEHSTGPYVPTHRPKGSLHTLSASCENSHTLESCRSGRHHLRLHHHLLQTRYLLTGTRRNVNFFTTRLHGSLRCARTSSDRLPPPVRAKVRSWRLGWDALKDAIVALAHA